MGVRAPLGEGMGVFALAARSAWAPQGEGPGVRALRQPCVAMERWTGEILKIAFEVVFWAWRLGMRWRFARAAASLP